MSLEEANRLITMYIGYVEPGWKWYIDTNRPYGTICGYNKYDTPDEALEELKQFLRYFTENVLKNGDTIRAYVSKHNPNSKK